MSLDSEWKRWNETHVEKLTRKQFRDRNSGPVSRGRVHIVIGDTQVKAGVPTAHLSWIGRYIVDHFAEKFPAKDVSIIHLGDHYDMPSLSSYDKGKKAMEGRRYKIDIDAGNAGWARLCQPLQDHNEIAGLSLPWWPARHFLLGNHENRITRAVEADAQLEGVLSLNDLAPRSWGWQVHDFLDVLELDGVSYSHYFYNPNTGKPYGGEVHTRLKTLARSFTMGHQQSLQYAVRPVGKSMHHGLVLGTTYLHDEDYLGPQGNAYWRGIVVCHQVENGSFDPMFVSLDHLCRRYENKTLAEYMKQ